jgi:hypothetical protein
MTAVPARRRAPGRSRPRRRAAEARKTASVGGRLGDARSGRCRPGAGWSRRSARGRGHVPERTHQAPRSDAAPGSGSARRRHTRFAPMIPTRMPAGTAAWIDPALRARRPVAPGAATEMGLRCRHGMTIQGRCIVHATFCNPAAGRYPTSSVGVPCYAPAPSTCEEGAPECRPPSRPMPKLDSRKARMIRPARSSVWRRLSGGAPRDRVRRTGTDPGRASPSPRSGFLPRSGSAGRSTVRSGVGSRGP